MYGFFGGVFANHTEYYPAWQSANHLEPIDEEPPPKRLKSDFVCERCGKIFTEKRSLVRHNRSAASCKDEEQQIQSFACTVADCFHTFKRDDIRKRHENETHFKIKRRQRGLSVLPNLRLGSGNRSGTRGATFTGQTSYLQAEEAVTDSPAAAGPEGNSVHGLSHEYRISALSKTSPSTSVFSVAESRNEQNTSPSSSSNASRRRWSSSTGSDMSTGSSLKFSTTSTSVTTYGSDTDQLSIVAETGRSGTGMSQDEDWLLARRVSFDLHPRRDLVKGGASARPASHRKVRICPLCSKSFGSTVDEVRDHLNRHWLQFEGQHKCQLCQIGFVHKADLDLHLANARQGSCGLQFEHTRRCNGHHPPTPYQTSMSDSDQMRMSYCLQNWEQAQLQNFRAVVKDVIDDLSSKSKPDDCWSMDGVLRRSVQSVSILFSGLDIRSAPEGREHRIRTAMHRVRRSVTEHAPIGPDRSIQIKLGKKSEKNIRLGRALVAAAARGNLEEMNGLILRGADINGQYKLRDESAECTPLMAAVCGGSLDAVKFLLENEAAVDGLKSQDEATVAAPLCLAAERGDMDILQCLLDYHANVNKESQDKRGHAACYAARNGHTEVLSALIDHGADIHLHAAVDIIVDDWIDYAAPLFTGNILAIAVHNDRLDCVRMLLKKPGIDFDYCDSSAALAMAAYQGNIAMIELLLERHAELCTFFALWVATSQGHKAAVNTFIDHQRRLKPRLPLQSSKILQRAVKQGQEDLASRMLSPHDGPKNLCDLDSFVIRHYESRCAYNLVAHVHPTSASMPEMNLALALNCAVYYQDLDAARVLLSTGVIAGAKIYPSNVRYLATNLCLASRIGYGEMVELLLRSGADPSSNGQLSLDLLEAALDSGSVETLRSLFDTGVCFVPKEDQRSCSTFNAAVHRAVRAGAIGSIQTLIDFGLDVNQLHVEDGSGRKTTLLQIAAGCATDQGSYEMMELLLENGAIE